MHGFVNGYFVERKKKLFGVKSYIIFWCLLPIRWCKIPDLRHNLIDVIFIFFFKKERREEKSEERRRN
jgi:hypothetical protein